MQRAERADRNRVERVEQRIDVGTAGQAEIDETADDDEGDAAEQRERAGESQRQFHDLCIPLTRCRRPPQ